MTAVTLLAMLTPWFRFSQTTVHAWLPRSGEAIRLFTPSPWSFPWTVQKLQHAFRQTVVGPWGDMANVVGVWPLVNAGGITRLSGAVIFVAVGCAIAALMWRFRRDPHVEKLLWIPLYAAS